MRQVYLNLFERRLCLASVRPPYDCTEHNFSRIFTAPDTVGTYNITVISQQKMKGSANSSYSSSRSSNALISKNSKINQAKCLKTLPPDRSLPSSSFFFGQNTVNIKAKSETIGFSSSSSFVLLNLSFTLFHIFSLIVWFSSLSGAKKMPFGSFFFFFLTITYTPWSSLKSLYSSSFAHTSSFHHHFVFIIIIKHHHCSDVLTFLLC